MSTEKEFHLSASTIKTYENCSWQYYAKKVLKVPEPQNVGAMRGDICHNIFEYLLNPRHKKHYDTIIKHKDINQSNAVSRLIKKYIKQLNIPEFDNKGINNLDLIKEMILVGLGCDFFCKGKILHAAEKEIIISDEEYKIVGYIDKLAEKNGKLEIYDYKSSQKKEDFSTQALTYILWAKRVKRMDAVAKFVYLRFGDDPIQKYKFNNDALVGFEDYVKSIYKELKNFDETKARRHFAYDDGWQDGWKGRSICGRSTYKDQLKKDGTPMWSCFCKWEQEYYVLVDKRKKIVISSLDKYSLIEKLRKEEYKDLELKKVKYSGCPKFKFLS